MLERTAQLDVELVSDEFELSPASPEALAAGANRALVGTELLQFADAQRTAPARWRLTGLLRGRGGTEAAAAAGQAVGAAFVLLDGSLVALDVTKLAAPGSVTIAALGVADQAPATAPLVNAGLSLKPLSPVHPRSEPSAAGGLVLRWTRRARGAWGWVDQLDAPLVEASEAYLVGVGDADHPALHWEVKEPRLELTPEQLVQLETQRGQPIWVRQIGAHALSDPLLLTTLL